MKVTILRVECFYDRGLGKTVVRFIAPAQGLVRVCWFENGDQADRWERWLAERYIMIPSLSGGLWAADTKERKDGKAEK